MPDQDHANTAHAPRADADGAPIDRRQLLKGAAAAAWVGAAAPAAMAKALASPPLHELGLAAAARAIRTGAVTAELYAKTLLDRAQAHADLKSFITIEREQVLEAARAADQARAQGRSGALLGVPIGVKDSYLTRGLKTTFGTAVLNDFKPVRDASLVAAVKDAGGIVFGKNNLAEMSYGLTGINSHHGQVLNPYDKARITGGSSSGGAASVAARIVPAALGGDTVGSIRLPASLCGVVGFKPTPGRWPDAGTAPISSALDAPGVLARSVEDCALIDAIATNTVRSALAAPAGLKGLRFAYAPRQHLNDIDPAVEALFRETLRKLRDAGADIVEIDLGEDFSKIAERATWPIFFHETMPAVRAFLEGSGIPVTFEQIYQGLGAHIKGRWTRFVVPGAPNFFSDETYGAVMGTERPKLRSRYNAAFERADVLLFPTVPCAAPTIESQWQFAVGGRNVADTFLAKNTYATNCAGLPGISLPMGLSADGLPLGIELDASAGRDSHLLSVARRVEAVIGALAGPAGF